MTVYCVMNHDYEGDFLDSIWSTKEKAEAEAAKRNAAEYPRASYSGPSYGVVEYEVDEVDE